MTSSVAQLAAIIGDLQRQVKAIGQSRLANSSIESGAISSYFEDEDGVTLGALIGLQPDGTHVAATVNGPIPPVPAGITVTAEPIGVRVKWNGSFVDGAVAPMDWSLLQVALVASPTDDPRTASLVRASIASVSGGSLLFPAAGGTEVYVRCYTVSLAGMQSAFTDGVAVTPITLEDSIDLSGVGGGTKFYYGPTEPTGMVEGEFWYADLGAGAFELMRYDGTDWVTITDQASIDAAAAAAAAASDAADAQAAADAAATAASGAQGTANSAATDAATGIANAATAASAAAAANTAAGNAQTTANSKIQTYRQTAAPTSPNNGDIWFDISGATVLQKRWNSTSSSWVLWQLGDGSFAPNSLTASSILATGTITTGLLNAGAVTAAKIAANTITAAQISAGTITGTEIAANTITAAKIFAGTITATELAANSITSAKIAAGAITADKIAAGTLSADVILSGDISTAALGLYPNVVISGSENSVTAYLDADSYAYLATDSLNAYVGVASEGNSMSMNATSQDGDGIAFLYAQSSTGAIANLAVDGEGTALQFWSADGLSNGKLGTGAFGFVELRMESAPPSSFYTDGPSISISANNSASIALDAGWPVGLTDMTLGEITPYWEGGSLSGLADIQGVLQILGPRAGTTEQPKIVMYSESKSAGLLPAHIDISTLTHFAKGITVDSGVADLADAVVSLPATHHFTTGLAVIGGGSAVINQASSYTNINDLGNGLLFINAYVVFSTAGSGTGTVGITIPHMKFWKSWGRQALAGTVNPMRGQTTTTAFNPNCNYLVLSSGGNTGNIDRLHVPTEVDGNPTYMTGVQILSNTTMIIQGVVQGEYVP